jgi:4-amino-4-deoxy-L-arabinose transferase-like glycosyltransferase
MGNAKHSSNAMDTSPGLGYTGATELPMEQRKRHHFYAAAIIAASALIRFWFVASHQLDLVQDEAQYWDWTRSLQLSYYSKGPLIAYIIKLWTLVFGNTELGARFGSILCGTGVQAVLYLGAAKVFKRPKAGLWTLAVLATAPLFVGLGVLMTTDSPLLLFWSSALVCLLAAARTEPDLEPSRAEQPAAAARTWPFGLYAICLALGTLAKYTMLFTVPLALVFAAGASLKTGLPRGYWRKLLISSLAGAAAGLLPVLVWNLQNDFVGLHHVTRLVGVEHADPKPFFNHKHFLPYFGAQVGLLYPWWLYFMLAGTASGFKRMWTRSSQEPLAVKRDLLLVTFFLPLWAFILFWSTHTNVYGNWGAVCYPSGALLAGLALEDCWRSAGPRLRRWLAGFSIASCVLLALIVFQNNLPIPARLNPTQRLKGWTDLGQTIQHIENNNFPNQEKVFVFSSNYDLTAALAFYAPGQPRTYCAWIDRRMSQYDLWPGPTDKEGWDAIYVQKKYRDRVDPQVQKMFDRMSPPIYIQTEHRGQPARKFTLRLCYGYNGFWPRDAQGGF